MPQNMGSKLVALALMALVLLDGAAGALIDECKDDPTDATKCANSDEFYDASSVAADVKMLCDAMPQMPSCRIRELCASGDITESSGHCGEWNFLSGICSTQYGENMQGMSGCTTYKAICADGSVVESCSDTTKQGPAELITTAEAKDGAVAFCAEYPDFGEDMGLSPADEVVVVTGGAYRREGTNLCEECDSTKCQLAVTILAQGCRTYMSQSFCSEFKKTCDANTNLNNICTFENSAAAPRHPHFLLVLISIASVLSLMMGPRS